jgi:hypothetical protein
VRRKAKGRFPFREVAPYSPISRRPGSVSRSQLIVTTESSGSCERSPRFPFLFRRSVRCKSFLVPSRCLQFPECLVSLAGDTLAGLVADSLQEFLSLSPCGCRFRFSWSSFPGSLASAASGSPMTFSALFYWRIAPPLIRKLLAICFGEQGGFGVYFCGNTTNLVEMRPKVCSCRGYE